MKLIANTYSPFNKDTLLKALASVPKNVDKPFTIEGEVIRFNLLKTKT